MLKSRKKLTILMVYESFLFIKSIDNILKEHFDCSFYFFNSCKQSIEVLEGIKVDLIFLDISFFGFDSVELIYRVKKNQKKSKIIVFSQTKDLDVEKNLKRMGVNGYINKDASDYEVNCLIFNLLSLNVANINNDIKEYKIKTKRLHPVSELSKREYEIAVKLVKGKKSLEISDELKLSLSTISTYKKRIYEKLKVKDIIKLSVLLRDFNKLKINV